MTQESEILGSVRSSYSRQAARGQLSVSLSDLNLLPPVLSPQEVFNIQRACVQALDFYYAFVAAFTGGNLMRLAEATGLQLAFAHELSVLERIGLEEMDLLARPDVVSTKSGPRVIELGATALSGGPNFVDLWDRVVLPVLRGGCGSVTDHSPVSNVVRALGDRLPSGPVALIELGADWDDYPGYFEHLEQVLRHHDLDVRAVPLEKIRFAHDGYPLLPTGQRLEAIIRYFRPPDAGDSRQTYERLLDAVVRFGIPLIGSPSQILTDPKVLMALAQEAAVRHERPIPSGMAWTRVLRDGATTTPTGSAMDLLTMVTSHKDRFVIKPGVGGGGTEVVFGVNCSIDEWYSVVNRHASDERLWIVQELAESVHTGSLRVSADDELVEASNATIDFGVFTSKGRPLGIWARAAAGHHAASNAAMGGATSGVLVTG